MNDDIVGYDAPHTPFEDFSNSVPPADGSLLWVLDLALRH